MGTTRLLDWQKAVARSVTHECPRCRGSDTSADLIRVPRRFIDRPISLIRPRYRSRCRSMGCGWEGKPADIPRREYASAQSVPGEAEKLHCKVRR